MIEQNGADLDPYADLSVHGADVEGMTEFFPNRGPKVSISEKLSNDGRRENRFRTTLTHEFGHVKFHGGCVSNVVEILWRRSPSGLICT